MIRKLIPIMMLAFVTVAALVLIGSASADRPGDEASRADRILAKYPSPDDIARQIRALQAAEPGAVEDIRADFDLAIRSRLGLDAPRPAHISRSAGGPGVMLKGLLPRQYLEEWIGEHGEDERWRELATFYRRHLDYLTLEDQPEQALVMKDILVRGWDDWSQWNEGNEALDKAREKFPELHRVYAIVELEHLHHKPAIGLLLRIVTDDADPQCGRAFDALRTIGNYDVAQFYVDWAVEPSTSNDIRWKLWTEIQMGSYLVDKEEALGFWKQYLDSDVPTLWYCAQKAFGRTIPEDRNWLRKAQSEWNYKHERDPAVRRGIDINRQIADIRKRENPETGRISLEDLAEIKVLQAELKLLEDPKEEAAAP